jgi:hypothetical protein
MLLILLERNINCASLRSLNEEKDVVFRRIVFFVFVNIYQILFDNVAMLDVRSVRFQFLTHFFYLMKADVQLLGSGFLLSLFLLLGS